MIRLRRARPRPVIAQATFTCEHCGPIRTEYQVPAEISDDDRLEIAAAFDFADRVTHDLEHHLDALATP